MYKRQLMVIGIVLLSAIVFLTFKFSSQEAQSNNPQQEATVVHKGQVTGKERAYSREFKRLYAHGKRDKINANTKKDNVVEEIVSFVGEYEGFYLPNARIVTSTEFLGNVSCQSDAVVIGLVKSKSSHLSEDETFIFTQYEISVQDVLKNNIDSPIEVNNTIEIVRPGGLIELDKQRFRMEDLSYLPLQKNKKYLLFLKFNSSANGYTSFTPKGDFLLENSSFKSLSKLELPKELSIGGHSQTLLNDVRNTASTICKQNL